jgi:hypothetical protein
MTGCGFPDLLVGDDDGLGDPVDQIASLHFHGEAIASRGIRRSELDLDFLCASLSGASRL